MSAGNGDSALSRGLRSERIETVLMGKIKSLNMVNMVIEEIRWEIIERVIIQEVMVTIIKIILIKLLKFWL